MGSGGAAVAAGAAGTAGAAGDAMAAQRAPPSKTTSAGCQPRGRNPCFRAGLCLIPASYPGSAWRTRLEEVRALGGTGASQNRCTKV
jgi:hypothetical protein